MVLIRLLAFACVVSLTPLVRADDAAAGKAVVKKVQDSAKTWVKACKEASKAALEAFDTELDALDGVLSPSTSVDFAVAQVGASCRTLLDSLQAARHAAAQEIADSAVEALGLLASGGELGGIFPQAFYLGTSGVLDGA